MVDKENKQKVKFQEEIDDYDDEGSDFDANELMDMSDYKNKRGIPSVADIANIKPNIQNAKPHVQADEAWELESDGWGEDNMEDLKRFDYKNTDLNKLTDA